MNKKPWKIFSSSLRSHNLKSWLFYRVFHTVCGSVLLMNHRNLNVCLFSDPDRISSHLTSAIVQAHNSTIYISSQDIREKCRMGIDQAKLFTFKNMVRQDCSGVYKRFSTWFLISVARGSVGNSCSRIDQHHQTDY